MRESPKYTLTSDAYNVDWDLRAQLDKLTDDKITPEDVDERVQAICQLLEERERPVRIADHGEPNLVSKYIRCFTHCFGLMPCVNEMEDLEACPNDDYVRYLMKHDVLVMRESSNEAKEGDHAVYFTSNLGCQHAR